HVQLRHQVAQRGDVELVRPEHLAQQAQAEVDFRGQLLALLRFQVDQLPGAGHPRHQYQPRVVGIVHQPQFPQRQRMQRVRIRGQARVQGVAGWCGVSCHGRPPRVQASATSRNFRVRLWASTALGGWWWRGSTSRLKAWPAPSYTYATASGWRSRWAWMSASGMESSSAPKWNSMG